MQLIWCLLSNFYLNMVRASLCPSSGEQECALPFMVFCTDCDGSGCVEHAPQCSTPYAAVHTLVLLMIGIMIPETCWDKSMIINIRLVASCWFLSLHPMFLSSCFFFSFSNIFEVIWHRNFSWKIPLGSSWTLKCSRKYVLLLQYTHI